MRVAAVVVPMLMMAASSRASESCMSKAEARQHFGTSYLYWHGPNHCWDATPAHKIDEAQRRNDLRKPHELMRKMLPDPEPVQSLAAPASLQPGPGAHDDATATGSLVDRAPDDVQAAPASVIERKAGQTIGMAPRDPPTDAGQLNPPLIAEHKDAPTTRSLITLSVVTLMAIAALGLIEFLFRPTYAERVLAFGAMRRSAGR